MVMSRGVRFGVWCVAVAMALGSGFLDAAAVPLRWAMALAGLVLMAWLLASTPASAIRLPRWLSWVVIVGGAGWLAGSGWRALTVGGAGAWQGSGSGIARDGGGWDGPWVGIGVSAAVALVVLGVWAGRRWIERRGVRRANAGEGGARGAMGAASPWRVVLWAWHPGLVVFLWCASLGFDGVAMAVGVGSATGLLLAGWAGDDACRVSASAGAACGRWGIWRPAVAMAMGGALLMASAALA